MRLHFFNSAVIANSKIDYFLLSFFFFIFMESGIEFCNRAFSKALCLQFFIFLLMDPVVVSFHHPRV